MRAMSEVVEQLGLEWEAIEPYGRDKVKVPLGAIPQGGASGKLVVVTAITPTPAGEGKTTTSIGLTDGLARIGKRAVLAIREPSLGPLFGMKGGGTGGGRRPSSRRPTSTCTSPAISTRSSPRTTSSPRWRTTR